MSAAVAFGGTSMFSGSTGMPRRITNTTSEMTTSIGARHSACLSSSQISRAGRAISPRATCGSRVDVVFIKATTPGIERTQVVGRSCSGISSGASVVFTRFQVS